MAVASASFKTSILSISDGLMVFIGLVLPSAEGNAAPDCDEAKAAVLIGSDKYGTPSIM
ncbi:hypothetical protein D3C85_953710 [compost metagenome]